MKKIFYFFCLLTLLWSCNDDKPKFLPKPDGTLDLGQLGAAAVEDVSALSDDNLKTYFFKDVDEKNEVTVEMGSNSDQVVAYTLVSSGLVEQKDNQIWFPNDPVAWTVYGSNDQRSWTKVDTRESMRFFARFQKHIYYLASAQRYQFYKFVFKTEGEALALSDILFHSQDPYEAWHQFKSPSINFIDLADDKGSRLYDLLVQDKTAYLQWHAREICTMLYFNDQEERMPVQTIDYFLEEMKGKVSHKAGAAPKVSIHYSTDWIQKSAGVSFLRLSEETRGVLFHEMVHAFQMEPKGIDPYQQGNLSWSAIEGLADAVRTQAGYHDYSQRNVNGSLMSGYKITGMFCYWLTQAKDKDAIRNINKSMRTEIPWSWDKALKFALGKDASEKKLWEEYRNDKTNYQERK